MWEEIIVVDATDLSFRGAPDNKRILHVADIFKGLMSLPNAPVIEEDWNVDVWSYRTYSEWPYVENLCSTQAKQLQAWRGGLLVHGDPIFFEKAILVLYFRYEERSSSPYGCRKVR